MNARTLGRHASHNPARDACSSAGAAKTREPSSRSSSALAPLAPAVRPVGEDVAGRPDDQLTSGLAFA
jgi:hypothetical protein